MHGADTMANTASALSFLLEGIDIPIVLTGARGRSPSCDRRQGEPGGHPRDRCRAPARRHPRAGV
ncbi:asparaginase domain-containing protein [Fodinibacter luteus]|uniref:asparaginase domain-containing protein n=1 Tax=Fodinibacter luteus TaxID=552064 RepID=UPI003CCC672E